MFQGRDLKILNVAASVNDIPVAGVNKEKNPSQSVAFGTLVFLGGQRPCTQESLSTCCLPPFFFFFGGGSDPPHPATRRQFVFTQRIISEISTALQVCGDDVLEG